ncbi:MAG: zinc ribbon domain-containing protein [Eubacteriaceae bacterium]|jgi:uncharacterized membrane protein YedE/YeeE|nr:zinc ribbon domain-containing protein [Eubacteriaceae bacterium]
MLEKIDKRNFKKVWIWYAVAAVIAAVAAAAVLYTVIGTGTAVTHHHDWVELLPLSGRITIASVAAAAGVFGIIYWVIVLECMIKQTRKDGANTMLFGILTLFFNVAAVIGYFIYRSFMIRCPSCGKIAKKGSLYCRSCGAALELNCKNCGSRVLVSDKFCGNCGHEM